MKIDAFIQDRLSLGDAQFLIGLALHQFDCVEEGEAVIGYLGINTKGNEKEQISLLMKQREELDRLVSGGNDLSFVLKLIQYFWTTPVLKKTKSRSRVNKETSLVSLQEALQSSNITQSDIYDRCKLIMLNYFPNEYLVLYLDTKPAKRVLANAVKSSFRVSHTLNYNVLDNATLDEIADNFKQRTAVSYAYAYESITGTPLAFIVHCFTDFYVRSCGRNEKNFDMFRILNRKGFEIAETEDGDSILDVLSIEDTRSSVDLDFTKTVSAIHKASSVLFGLQQEEDCYFDIYSHHRQKLVRERMESVSGVLKRMGKYWITTCDDEVSTEVGSDAIKAQYRRNRSDLCDYMEKLLDDGICKESMYEFVQGFVAVDYQFSAGANTSASVKNPKSNCILRYNHPGDDKQTIYSNSQKIELIVNGYFALKNLLDFINSKSNCYGITIFNFRTDIFRQPSLHRRFYNMADYVLYIDISLSLIDSVRKDSVRRQGYLYGIKSNDIVWKYISAEQGVKVMNELRSVSMGHCQIASTIEKRKNTTRDNILVYEYLKDTFAKENSFVLVTLEDAMAMALPNLMWLLESCCVHVGRLNAGKFMIVNTEGDRDLLAETLNNYRICCNFAACFQAFLTKCLQAGIYDQSKDNYYLTDYEDASTDYAQAFVNAAMITEKYPYVKTGTGKTPKSLMNYSYFCVYVLMNYLRGNDLELEAKSTFVSGRDMHTFFAFTALMENYFVHLKEVSTKIVPIENPRSKRDGKKDNNFINTALFAAHSEVLTDSTQATSLQAMASLLYPDTRRYLRTPIDYEEEDKHSASMLELYAVWFTRSRALQKSFASINCMIDTLIQKSEGMSIASSEEASMLKSADLSLSATPDDLNRINRARIALKGLFEFSADNHFALRNGRYYKYGPATMSFYVHEYGYLVRSAGSNKAVPFTVEVMTDDILNRIRGDVL